MFEQYPTLDAAWSYLRALPERYQILIGVFIVILVLTPILKARRPKHGVEPQIAAHKTHSLFLKIYPLLVVACRIGLFAGLSLVGMGVAGHFGVIDFAGFSSQMPALEVALYSCAIPFGALMGMLKFRDVKRQTLARIAAHEAAEKDAGPIRSY